MDDRNARRDKLPTLMHAALRLVDTLEEHGYAAYLVGGCVRDFLLGRHCKDADVCTSATPEQVAEIFDDTEFVGAHFGVTLVRERDLPRNIQFEVATFRKDGPYTDKRRPDYVEYTTQVLDDLRRRDFTINTLLMNSSGAVIDVVRGRRDLEEKLIRANGPARLRFQQDALRMLRAVRFAAQLGFEIETETRRAIQEMAHTITAVSPERTRDELTKILTSGRADYGVKLLMELELMDHIIPEFLALLRCKQNPKHHPEGDVYEHTLGLLAQLPLDASPTLALAALLHDIGKPATAGIKDDQPTFYGHEDVGATMTRAILNRLKYPAATVSTVTDLVADHMRFRVVEEMRRSKLLRFLGQPNFPELLELHKMDARAGRGNMEHADYVEKVLAETPEEILHPVRLVTGKDLIDMGEKPGPFFRFALEYVQTEQLEGRVADRDAALSMLRSMAAAPDRDAIMASHKSFSMGYTVGGVQ